MNRSTVSSDPAGRARFVPSSKPGHTSATLRTIASAIGGNPACFKSSIAVPEHWDPSYPINSFIRTSLEPVHLIILPERRVSIGPTSQKCIGEIPTRTPIAQFCDSTLGHFEPFRDAGCTSARTRFDSFPIRNAPTWLRLGCVYENPLDASERLGGANHPPPNSCALR